MTKTLKMLFYCAEVRSFNSQKYYFSAIIANFAIKIMNNYFIFHNLYFHFSQ